MTYLHLEPLIAFLGSSYWSFLTSLIMSLGLVATAQWHTSVSSDLLIGVQKLHIKNTPRVGGIAIFAGVGVAYLVSPLDLAAILGPLWIAGSLAFFFGLCEDFTKCISVRLRLLATIFSGLAGYAITGVSLERVGVPFLDSLFSYTVISVVFTSLAVGGIANAINIIDGLNGLASSMLIIALVALAAIAQAVGDTNLSASSLVAAAAIFGFFLINWPLGKLFMGDGGSYFSGFAFAWLGVLLVERNPSISPFAVLILCIYPFTEVLFSVYRRRSKNLSLSEPDKQHLHSLIYRRYIVSVVPTVKENSVAGIVVGLMSVPSGIIAYLVRESNWLAILACFCFIFGYVVAYRRVVRFRWGVTAVAPRREVS
jgi:UDP-N-acetylmuramyl pentapeptide phosphotransferase/UDP-N-acetylglucosamine-1-phosphate transferase